MERAVGAIKFGVESAASGERTLFLEREGKRRYLHSRNAPGRDGTRFRDEHPFRGCGLLVFIGLGLGHHIRPFLDDSGTGEIAVLEPVRELFEAVRNTEEIRSLSRDTRVGIYAGADARDFAEGLAGRYDALVHGSVKILRFPPLCSAFPSVYRALEERARSRLENLAGDGVTIGRFARIWLENFASNVRNAGTCYPVSALFGSSGGVAVVTGAGPSLDTALPALKAFRRRFFLIATDASVKPLSRGGLLPDLIVSVDPQPLVRLHFQGVDRGALAGVPAALSLLSCPEVFGSFEKRYLFFTLHPTTGLFDAGRLRGQGAVFNYRSVGSYALKIALEMGFGTVLLAGFDFSYPGLRVYARDSFFHDAGLERWSRFNPHLTMEAGAMAARGVVRTRAAGGEDHLLTSRTLAEYAAEFESITAQMRPRGARILRLGTQGIRLEGAQPVENSRIDGLFEDLFRKTESKPREPLVEPFIKSLLEPDPAKWGAVRRDLILTLALRRRIFQGARSGEEALEQARRSVENWVEKKTGFLKFDSPDSDT